VTGVQTCALPICQSHISLKTIRENLEREIYYIKKPFNREEFFCLTDSLLKGWNKNIQLKKYYEQIEKEIIERKQTEGKMNAMLSSIGDHMSMMDKDLNIIWANDVAGQIFGSNLTGKKCYEAYHRRKEPCTPYPCLTLKAFKDGKVHKHETEVRDKEGNKIFFHCTANVALRDKDGNPEAVMEVSRNITDQKLKEKAINYRLAIEELVTTISTHFINLHAGEIDGEIESTLKKIGEFTGDDRCYIYLFSNNDFIINTVYEWYKNGLEEQVKTLTGHSVKPCVWALEKIGLSEPLTVSSLKNLTEKACAEKEIWQGLGIKSILAIPIIVDDSTSGFLGFHSEKKEKNWKKEDIKLLRLVGEIFVNALKRKKGEEALRESERNFKNLYKEYNSLMETIPDRVLLISSNMKILWANSVVKSERGDENLFNKTCYKAIYKNHAPCSMCPVVKCFSTGIQEREQILTPDNKYFDIIATPIKDEEGKIIKVLEVARDITEKMFLQKDAVRTSHLASIGELAAGVAHEINNPVTGIINYAQILANKSKEETREYDICRRIIKEGERIALITRSLLSFAKPGREKKRPVPLNEIIADTMTLSGTQMAKEDIKTIIKLPEDLPDTIVNPAQIQQVFLNILSNARHALNKKYPERNENKTIEISAEKIINNQSYIKIIFTDYGCGISESIIDKVMNPFFSTEPIGEATGLGLSISYGIIKEHNGKIEIESNEGDFTRIIITLPVAPKTSSKKIDKNHFF